MRLYTLQHQLVGQTLQNQQNWLCAKTWAEPDFNQAYSWIEKQMINKAIVPPNQNTSPIWAWAQYDGQRKKRPDLRLAGHLDKGTQGVLIEIEKESSELLLSDFLLWHYVLNQGYLPERLEADNNHANAVEKEQSWQRIFDLSFSAQDITEPIERKKLQATFWVIRPQEVISMQHFVAR